MTEPTTGVRRPSHAPAPDRPTAGAGAYEAEGALR